MEEKVSNEMETGSLECFLRTANLVLLCFLYRYGRRTSKRAALGLPNTFSKEHTLKQITEPSASWGMYYLHDGQAVFKVRHRFLQCHQLGSPSMEFSAL